MAGRYLPAICIARLQGRSVPAIAHGHPVTGLGQGISRAGPDNGGDGYVVARLLRDAGWPVRVAQLPGNAAGDAAVNAERWRAADGAVVPVGAGALDGAGLVIDALFGAGLRRPLGAEVCAVFRT